MEPTSPTSSTDETKTPAANRFAIPGALSRMWIPVRAKITAPFFLIAIVMATVVAFIIYQIVFENIDQRFNTQLVESGRLASEWMVKEENTQLAALRILSYTVGVGDALQAKDAEALRKATLGYTIGNQEDAVEFLDAQGKLVLSMRHRPGSMYVEDYVFGTGGEVDYTQWPFVKQVIAGHSDQQGDKYSGLARASWGDYFYVSGPVYDNTGKLAGVILVGEEMTNLVRKMRLDIGTQVTIYGLDGKPIASTFDPTALTSSDVTSVLENQKNSSLRRDSAGQRSLTFEYIDYGEILGPWKLRSSQDEGLIGTAIPKNLLVQTSTNTRIQLAILVGLALLLVLMIGGMIANLITRPLSRLVEASREVAGGNLNVKIMPQSNDEIAVLTDNFNQMIANIEQSHSKLLTAYKSTLESWSKAMDLRDNETELHMQRVTELTVRLAKRMGFKGEQLTDIYQGALLHDIGKIGISDDLLKYPGKLTELGWIQMRKHPQYAYDMLYPIEHLRSSLDIPYCHHEKWDGSGYPNGLKGEEIPMVARIFTIVDVWDAMTSDRVYRKALSEEDVVKYIIESRGTHFDPQVVDAFLAMMGKS
jgi:HD-GYP domain-containing protein (c-di-GMP phosphodiesterase class II)